jgi:hypothetical protein
MERRKIDNDPLPYRERGLELPLSALLDDFARHWKQHIAEIEHQRQALSLDERGRLYELRYEDICADPQHELAGLAGFLAVDPNDFRPNNGRLGAIKNQNFKFRHELDAETVARLTSIMQPELALKGYAT